MATQTSHWKLGLFIVMGGVVAVLALGFLGARSLSKEVGHYVSYFDESVQGLELGSPIKFRGVTIGTVGKIDIGPDHRHVEVTSDLGVDELHRLGLNVVKTSTHAGNNRLQMAPDLRIQIASAGLTGVKFLQLDFFPLATHPPPDLPFPVPANYIPATSSAMKDLEDSAVRAMNRMPEIADRLSAILLKVDNVLGAFAAINVPQQLTETLGLTKSILLETQAKLRQVNTGELSVAARRLVVAMEGTVVGVDRVVASLGGETGLIANAKRTSTSLDDTARSAAGVSAELERTLRAVEAAAKSLRRLTDALEKEPDMLVKGRVVEGKR